MDQGQRCSLSPPHTKKTPRIKLRKLRETSWTVKQQTAYVLFLQRNMNHMKTTASRKLFKVFKKLSECVVTRTPVQAKSHHQKLEEKYETLSSIIYHVNLFIKYTLEKQEQKKIQEKQGNQVPRMVQEEKEVSLKDANTQFDFTIEATQQNPSHTSFRDFFDEISESYGPIEGNIGIDDDCIWF